MTSLGQCCLLARRLVEAGCRFVSIENGHWDTHRENTMSLRDLLVPSLDRGFAALVTDLDERGLLDSTLVVLTTEFGRTPRINKMAGRDHWPQAFSIVMAGGGIKPGRVIGATDKDGASVPAVPLRRPTWPRRSCTARHRPATRLHTPVGRPVELAGGGRPVHELFERQHDRKYLLLLLSGCRSCSALPRRLSSQQVPTDPDQHAYLSRGGAAGIGRQCSRGRRVPSAAELDSASRGPALNRPEVLGPRAQFRGESSPRRKPGEQISTTPRNGITPFEIAADAPAWPAAWWLSWRRGGTGGRPFIVGDLPEFIETESNSTPERAEHSTLPVTSTARSRPAPRLDYYCISMQAQGEVIVAEVVAARSGSRWKRCSIFGTRLAVGSGPGSAHRERFGARPESPRDRQDRFPCRQSQRRWRAELRLPNHAFQRALRSAGFSWRRTSGKVKDLELLTLTGETGFRFSLRNRSLCPAVPGRLLVGCPPGQCGALAARLWGRIRN